MLEDGRVHIYPNAIAILFKIAEFWRGEGYLRVDVSQYL